MRDGNVFYAKSGTCYFIKLTGNVRFTISREFDNFIVNELFKDKDFDNIMIDLTEAEYLDSTILGLLARIANLMRVRCNRKVTILSDNPNINFLLDNIGFGDVFIIVEDSSLTTEPLKKISDRPGSGELEQAKVILEAHQLLMNMNEKNNSVFKSLVDALQKEVSQIAGKTAN